MILRSSGRAGSSIQRSRGHRIKTESAVPARDGLEVGPGCQPGRRQNVPTNTVAFRGADRHRKRILLDEPACRRSSGRPREPLLVRPASESRCPKPNAELQLRLVVRKRTDLMRSWSSAFRHKESTPERDLGAATSLLSNIRSADGQVGNLALPSRLPPTGSSNSFFCAFLRSFK